MPCPCIILQVSAIAWQHVTYSVRSRRQRPAHLVQQNRRPAFPRANRLRSTSPVGEMICSVKTPPVCSISTCGGAETNTDAGRSVPSSKRQRTLSIQEGCRTGFRPTHLAPKVTLEHSTDLRKTDTWDHLQKQWRVRNEFERWGGSPVHGPSPIRRVLDPDHTHPACGVPQSMSNCKRAKRCASSVCLQPTIDQAASAALLDADQPP